jgi:hypothetical protein
MHPSVVKAYDPDEAKASFRVKSGLAQMLKGE